MGISEALAHLNPAPGETQGYISPQDVKNALTEVYTTAPGRVTQADLPRKVAQASGRVNVTINGGSPMSSWVTVTFPTGRFTSAPVVTASAYGNDTTLALVPIAVVAQGTSDLLNFKVAARWTFINTSTNALVTASNAITIPVHWHAIENAAGARDDEELEADEEE